MILANVIFPAFTAPYLSFLFFHTAAAAAIMSEILVFKFRHKTLTWGRTVYVALAANITSWIAGVILGLVLPSGLVPKVMGAEGRQFTTITQGPHFDALIWIGFGVAFVLSIQIEYLVWKRCQRRLPLVGLFYTTFIAHIASYALLIGIACAHIKLGWW
jgi:hypothetical protein